MLSIYKGLNVETTATGDAGIALNANFVSIGDALENKAGISHSHVIGDVTGLQDALNGKISSSPTTYSFVGGQTISYGTTAPISGAYILGSMVFNSAPTATDYAGWICVSAGSPGIWKGFGLIEE